jgi:predicted phage tail protein
MTFHDRDLIRGSKGGGGGKGKGGGGGDDSANTLRSKARARFVEIISEGPCEGLVGGAKGMFYENTPVQNADGTFNFPNVVWQQRLGTPDQEHVNGHSAVETMHQVEVEVKNATGPVLRTINEENADAVRVIVRIPALAQQNKKDGSIQTTSVSYQIEVRGYGGTWQVAHVERLNNQKTTSAVQRAHRVVLPAGGHPWDLRLRRNTADSNDERLANETWWESYTTLVEGKFIYPNTALVAQEVNAEDMGQTIPARAYRWRGLKTLVPSNYDPITRTYTGLWDGTFKVRWHSNPVWVFYDLLINDRYGLGEFVNAATIDKWSLYAIAQHCDEMIPSGFKNADTGEDILEPRFSFNGVINSREEAYKVLQQITTTWRGMAFWSRGQVWATADMPADPFKIVTPANTIKGEFSYSGTGLKARHSVAIVAWNNPDDFYNTAYEVVINDEMLQQFGWREKKVDLIGCTSRGLAHRYGKWLLDIEQHETETVEYVASWDHADLRPGHIIAIADPRKAQFRIGGRLAAATTTMLTFDFPFAAKEGEVYSVYCTLPSGEVVKRPIQSFDQVATDIDGNEGFLVAHLGEALPDTPVVNALWTITGTDIAPRQYRVLAVSEQEKNKFQVTALFHDPTKYARVEQNITLDPPTYTRPPVIGQAPNNLKVVERNYLLNGQNRSTVTLSWSDPSSYMTREYEVAMLSPTRGYYVLGTTANTFADFENLEPGEYTFFVTGVSYALTRSPRAELLYEVVGWGASAEPLVGDLHVIDGNGNEFTGRDIRIAWTNKFPGATDPTADDGVPADIYSPFYDHNTIKAFDAESGDLLRIYTARATSFTYTFEMNRADNQLHGRTAQRDIRFEVTCTDAFGRESAPVSIVASNPVPVAFNPNYYVAASTINLSWPTPIDGDFAGVLVWVSQDENFDPYTTAPIFDGLGASTTLVGEPLTLYYVRVAAYDAFGKADLNISPALEIRTDSSFDMDPPAAPTGLAIVSAMAANGLASVVGTWSANTEEDISHYEIQASENDGEWLGFLTSETSHAWNVRPGISMKFRVRAYDKSNNPSAWSEEVTHVVARDTVAPAVPQGVTAQGLFRSNWIDWEPVADTDLAFYEVEATINGLSEIFSVGANPSIHSNLNVGDVYIYRVRAVDTSDNRSDWSNVVTATVGAINPGDLPPDALISTFALIDQAFIESAHIIELDAARIKAGSVLAGNVKVATSAGNLDLSNPAAIVNAATTLIEPGKIQVGSGSLTSLLTGPDLTEINGGKIAANTIKANSIVIGARGVTVSGIQFEHNSPAANRCAWSAGSISYVDDDGTTKSVDVAAGSTAAWTAGTMYIYWVKAAATLSVTTVPETAFAADRIVIATYRGELDLNANYGRTVIDGANIKTGSIDTDQLKANSVKAVNMSVDALSSISANIGTVTAGKMQSEDGKFVIDLTNKFISITV